MDDLHATLARRLRELAARRRWPVYLLADHAGVGRATLARIVAGEASPTLRVIRRLAQALGVPVGALLADDEKPLASSFARSKVEHMSQFKVARFVGTQVDEETDAQLRRIEEALGPQLAPNRRTAPALRFAIAETAKRLPRAPSPKPKRNRK